METVLSTGKYRNLVLHAQSRGFEVRLIYIVVKSAELQIDRIKARVAEGGHHVDDAKVRTRRLRSFRQLRWFCMHADKTFVFDNSTGEPELIASFLPGASVVERRRVPNDLWNTLKRTVPQATFL